MYFVHNSVPKSRNLEICQSGNPGVWISGNLESKRSKEEHVRTKICHVQYVYRMRMCRERKTSFLTFSGAISNMFFMKRKCKHKCWCLDDFPYDPCCDPLLRCVHLLTCVMHNTYWPCQLPNQDLCGFSPCWPKEACRKASHYFPRLDKPVDMRLPATVIIGRGHL